MVACAVTVFLSAFLLFQVQMVLAKFILPWYGGVPAVWTSAMLFFQCLLLAGYAYAHWLARRAGATQRALHLLVLGASLAALLSGALAWGGPLLPSAAWKPLGDEEPVWRILVLLAAAVGAPFFVLAATAPLVQAWFSRAHGRSPYRLYAVSNLGSVLGLLSYPLLVEVYVPLRLQATAWALGYLLFALAIGYLAVRHAAAAPAAPAAEDAAPAPPAGARLLWFALAACASVLLLAITNQLSQEIAVVPLLWVLPLSLYLLSFVLCFDGDRWYPRPVYLALLVPALGLATLTLQHGVGTDVIAQIVLYGAALFVACMVCHGELARLKPSPRHLTSFYLAITAGGAAGGAFVALVAPALFAGYWELSLGLWGCAALAVVALRRDAASWLRRPAPAYLALFAAVLLAAFAFPDLLRAGARAAVGHPLAAGVAVAVTGSLVVLYAPLRRGAAALVAGREHGVARAAARLESVLARSGRTPLAAIAAALAIFGAIHLAFALESHRLPISATRNFFGVLQVVAEEDEDGEVALTLRHGRTLHGMQSLAPGRRGEPNTYYVAQSGVGLALREHPRRRAGLPLRIGVVGLGTGTLAAYGRAGDAFRFYEINPAVESLAGTRAGALFTYLRDSPAAASVVLGDARLALERELRQGRAQGFDILVLDAFSSGAIPVHLLTREAVALYLAHLAPDHGVLALHISNRYLDLRPLVAGLAGEFGLSLALHHHEDPGRWSSTWALLARRPDALPLPAVQPPPSPAVWRDDYSNLLSRVAAGPDRRPADDPAAIAAEAYALDPAR